MLAFVFCSLLFCPVLGINFLKKDGECPGPGKNPGQPVLSCDYYCKNGTGYYRAHYQVGTQCEYAGEVGTCLEMDGSVNCHSPEDPAVSSWKEKGSETTKQPRKKPDKKGKKKKKQSKPKNGTITSKKPKSKKNKSRRAASPDW